MNARAKAKSTGKPVVVDAMTTETSQTLINPDGSASTTDNAQPVRTKTGKAWADLDATLRKNADGTLSPAVSSVGLTLSGGGSGPMATITTADGKKLAVTAPFALPAPALDGASATYPNVLPDVDLKVTVLPTGGWRDVIIVKTSQAAADARLKSLHFPLSADGLNVSSDNAGNISLKDAAGKVRLHAPTPLQWDSALPAPAAPGAKAVSAPSVFAAPHTTTQPPVGTSTTDGPGEAAHESPIAVKADSKGFDLTPDPATFGKGTGPWYIDPSISADSGTAHSAQVQEYHPDTSYYDAVSDLGTGYCGYSDCTGYGRERAYFSININPAIYTKPGGAPSAPTLYGSALYANADGASSPGTSTYLGLYWTGPIGTGVTWNNQPCNGGGTFGGCAKVGNSFGITGTGPISFDVTSQMQQAAQQWANWTVGIAPDDENNKLYRHHIANNPHITTTYDLQPSIWYPRTTPRAGSASNNTSTDCTTDGTTDGTNIAWIGANQNITFTANNWSPAGMNLHTIFRLWNDQGWTWTGDSGWAGGYNPNGVSVNAGSLVDGRRYAWTANAFDADPTNQGLGSPDSTVCAFRVDKTPPTVAITSTDFPPSGTPNPTPGKHAGDTGTFTLSGTDPAPAGGEASGLACYRVSSDPTPVTGWHCTDGPGNGIVLPSNPTYSFTPTKWGTNVLYAQAQDNAGNYSQPFSYAFYAPWNPSSKAVFGDVTGDGKPDVLLPDAAGNLKVVSTGTDPVNATSFSAAVAPSGNWNGLQVTHRSTLRTPVFPVDDLVVHKPGDPMMYLYTNTGQGTYGQKSPFYPSGSATPSQATCVDTSNQPVVPGTPSGCPTGVGYDFSQVTQVLALGNPDNEVTTAPLSKTALVVVINGSLWLMPPGARFVLLSKTDTQLSSAIWDGSNNTDGYDLIGPGPANGTTSYTLNGVTTTVNQATLWARDRKTGQILAYPITKNADGTTNYTALADPTKGTVIGTGFDTTTYPVVGSSGDLTGDGVPDLWATNAAGQLTTFTGAADATGKVTGFTNTANPTSLTTALGQWKLAGADSTGTKTADTVGQATDPLGSHPGTLTNISFAPDTINNNSTTAATFNGNSEIDTSATLDTNKSFKIDVWAKPSALGGVVASSDGNNSSGFILWPEASDSTWRFALNWSDDTSWNYDQTTDVMIGNHVQLNTWAHLTAVFNADTRQTSLYVNGVLAANGRHPGSSGINGPIVMGRYKYQSLPTKSPNYSGSIADLTVYSGPAALSSSKPGLVISGMAGNKCLDNNSNLSTLNNTIQVWDCYTTAPSEQWVVNSNGTLNTANGCLDNTNAISGNGNVVHWYTCNGTPAQLWIPRADGSLYNPGSGRCLDLPSGNTANGNPLQIWDCTPGSPNQRWLIPTSN